MEQHLTAKRQPKKCPACGSVKVAKILYGSPCFDQKMEGDLAEGRLVLGGCCISGRDPVWKCVDCGIYIYRKSGIAEMMNY